MYAPLEDKAFTPLAIHTGSDVSFAAKSKEESNLKGLMLMDFDDQIIHDYQRPGEAEVLFPLAYLVAPDGIIANIYVNEEPELQNFLETIEALLP